MPITHVLDGNGQATSLPEIRSGDESLPGGLCLEIHRIMVRARAMEERMIKMIPYNRIAVVGLGYRESDLPIKLDGFGFLTGRNEGLDILGVQWCSSIYPSRAPAGTVLMRVMCGGWEHPEITALDDERLLAVVTAGLRRTMCLSAAPLFHHIVRWDRAIPQYLIGHNERVAQIEKLAARHSGLFLAGNAYHGVALNDCTQQAEEIAGRIAATQEALGIRN